MDGPTVSSTGEQPSSWLNILTQARKTHLTGANVTNYLYNLHFPQRRAGRGTCTCYLHEARVNICLNSRRLSMLSEVRILGSAGRSAPPTTSHAAARSRGSGRSYAARIMHPTHCYLHTQHQQGGGNTPSPNLTLFNNKYPGEKPQRG